MKKNFLEAIIEDAAVEELRNLPKAPNNLAPTDASSREFAQLAKADKAKSDPKSYDFADMIVGPIDAVYVAGAKEFLSKTIAQILATPAFLASQLQQHFPRTFSNTGLTVVANSSGVIDAGAGGRATSRILTTGYTPPVLGWLIVANRDNRESGFSRVGIADADGVFSVVARIEDACVMHVWNTQQDQNLSITGAHADAATHTTQTFSFTGSNLGNTAYLDLASHVANYIELSGLNAQITTRPVFCDQFMLRAFWILMQAGRLDLFAPYAIMKQGFGDSLPGDVSNAMQRVDTVIAQNTAQMVPVTGNLSAVQSMGGA